MIILLLDIDNHPFWVGEPGSGLDISKSILKDKVQYFVHRQKTSAETSIKYEDSASISMKELYGSPRNVSLSKSGFNSYAILRKISCAESCDSYCRIFHPNLLCGLPLNKRSFQNTSSG